LELTVRDHLDLLTRAMADADIDVLMIGRQGNSRWVTGALSLSLSGTRPFAPGCIVVREPPSVHLLSITDDGIPPDIATEGDLFPISWNPMNLMGALAAIPGVPTAARIGVDSITPMMEQLLGATFPDAELVDGEVLLRNVRRVKSAADVDGIRAAVALAEDCLRTTINSLTPGVRERELVGVFEEHMASHGTTAPAFEGMFVVANDGGTRSLVSDRELAEGDLVHLRGGVLRDGWEGWLSRSAVCGVEPSTAQQGAAGAWRGVMIAVADWCRPGTSVGELRSAADGVTVDGVGVGHEELSDRDVLEPGMVLAIEATVDGLLGSDTLLVTPDGSETLTTLPAPLG
jgi:Xaa-Pro dipeptidase